ncbi:BURP domain-containing protein 5-like isoform X2 [Neltuma alba]|uniref:BURP domain-containing protein 5-like isoform X2 n=1 Tax=Neltuma alba TaxID=207710 RepID=UPI0010A4F779|nr:BURP domain-containing protein 5-like isoform X2 [Prosopis alba]
MLMCMFILFMKLLLIAVVATHAVLTPELYWKYMLPPATPMPKYVADLLHPTGGGSVFHCDVTDFHPNVEEYFTGYGNHKSTYYPQEYFTGYGNHKSEAKLPDNPDITLFFLGKDLKAGHKMNLIFHKSPNQACFLPRDVVKSIPFSSTEMAEILNKFAVKPGSISAEVMKNTIKECEEPGIKGEDKYCATSLESMLDLTILKLGRNVQALSTEVVTKKEETKKQEYTITNGVKKVGETNLVVCHKMNYAYAVFYCHKIENTVAYTVSLEGADGSRVKAVSVCPRDTSAWDPKHLAFQMLKVKPGSVPICHFLFQDTIAWLPKQN